MLLLFMLRILESRLAIFIFAVSVEVVAILLYYKFS
jgi:hypothetical protein